MNNTRLAWGKPTNIVAGTSLSASPGKPRTVVVQNPTTTAVQIGLAGSGTPTVILPACTAPNDGKSAPFVFYGVECAFEADGTVNWTEFYP
jgi:hypothetical protein